MSHALYRVEFNYLISVTAESADVFERYFDQSEDGTFFVDEIRWKAIRKRIKKDLSDRKDIIELFDSELKKSPDGFSFTIF